MNGYTRGIGSKIIKEIIEEAKSKNIPVTLMVLNINPAVNLYKRLGFHIINEITTSNKGIKYKMSTELTKECTEN